MATYAIGDIQGCYLAFSQLLQIIKFRPEADRLFILGDLVNRGKESLAVLRHVYQWRESIFLILGNHDLYLLMIAAGLQQPRADDTLNEILNAEDRDILLDWLRRQPLCRQIQVAGETYTAVHAGLLPTWTAHQALELAGEISQQLQSHNYQNFLRQLWGSPQQIWQDDLAAPQRWQIIVNAMTRMRFCSLQGDIDYHNKGGIKSARSGFYPWFDIANRVSSKDILLTGHWSALGLKISNNHYSLDSAYLWGGELTALRLDDMAIFQVHCPANDALAID